MYAYIYSFSYVYQLLHQQYQSQKVATVLIILNDSNYCSGAACTGTYRYKNDHTVDTVYEIIDVK
jgi:predicted secreted protein